MLLFPESTYFSRTVVVSLVVRFSPRESTDRAWVIVLFLRKVVRNRVRHNLSCSYLRLVLNCFRFEKYLEKWACLLKAREGKGLSARNEIALGGSRLLRTNPW